MVRFSVLFSVVIFGCDFRFDFQGNGPRDSASGWVGRVQDKKDLTERDGTFGAKAI